MIHKPPAFQFYPGDWLSDENVVLMSNAARGLYITLLCHCWLEGSIPADLNKLSKISNEKRKNFEKIWREVESCFSKNGDTGRLINNRLEKERTKQEHYRKERSESGKMGANKRWLSHGSPIKQPLANYSSSSSSSSSNISYSVESCTLQVPVEVKSRWQETYKAINIDYEIKKMEEWILANPKNKKSNWQRFIVNWLSRAQDKAPAKGGGKVWKDDIPFL